MSTTGFSIPEPQQLSLAIRLNDQATFENFYCIKGSIHIPVVSALKAEDELFIYLWGASGTGISHLLQAACHHGREQGLHTQYLPLTDLQDFPPQELFDNLETLDLICLDDLQCVAGKSNWEQPLFDLYNRVRERGGRMLVSSDCAPRDLPVNLPDLQSRLHWGPVFHLPSMDDEEKVAVIQFRANQRGIAFGEESVRFLIRRSGRGMQELITNLNKLEQLAVNNQRKLTIPFLKQTFGW